jgi:hypothetical protein
MFLKKTTESIGTDIMKITGAVKMKIIIVWRRVIFSENSSMVSSPSVRVLMSVIVCLKYAIGTYKMFKKVKIVMNVRAIGKYKQWHKNLL